MKRRRAREYTLQLLYMLDAGGPDSFRNSSAKELIALHKRFYPAPTPELQPDDPFWQKLLQTSVSDIERIDDLIESRSQHWKLQRMNRVDRSILRLAAAEFLAFTDIAPSVTIDEALELAKRYGTEESAPFVNGVLDSLWKSIASEFPKPSS